MGVRLEHGGGGDDLGDMHEINVTPFIDVILVLLIIFMIAAPLATVDAPVDLPASTAKPQPRPDKPVFLTVRADRALLLGEAPVAREALGAALDREFGGDREGRVFLHRGIAARQFQRAFVLAEGIEVEGAWLDNGLLHVDLRRPQPEVRVKKIEINGKSNGAARPVVEGRAGGGA